MTLTTLRVTRNLYYLWNPKISTDYIPYSDPKSTAHSNTVSKMLIIKIKMWIKKILYVVITYRTSWLDRRAATFIFQSWHHPSSLALRRRRRWWWWWLFYQFRKTWTDRKERAGFFFIQKSEDRWSIRRLFLYVVEGEFFIELRRDHYISV